jgi:hypothetical protein
MADGGTLQDGALEPPAPSVPDATNVLTVREPLQSARTNFPLQLGRAFARGKYVRGIRIKFGGSSLPTQVDVKNRWPDGSVRFAILSAVVPSIPAGSELKLEFESVAEEQSRAAPTLESFLAANPSFDAALVASLAGKVTKVSARALLAKVKPEAWIAGPIASTFIIADHSTERSFDFGSTSLRSIRPIFHLSVWHGLKVAKVRFIGENANSEALEDATFDVSMLLGSGAAEREVFKQAQIVQHFGSRFTKAFWFGETPKPLSINHNVDYLAGLRVVPNYDPKLTLSEVDIVAQQSRWDKAETGLFQKAFWDKYMPGPGGREEIALFPEWTVNALVSGDHRLMAISEGHADLAAAWPMHFREGSSTRFFDAARKIPARGAVVSLFARPGMWYGTQNFFIRGAWIAKESEFTFGAPTTNGDWVPDGSHQPAPYLAHYLMSGDYWHLEQMQFWAGWGAFLASIDLKSGFYGRGPTLSSASLSGDIRTQAWTLRNRVSAAAFSVDGSKEKAYFDGLVLDAIAVAEGVRGINEVANMGNPSWLWGVTTGRSAGDGFYSSFGVHPLHMWDCGSESFAMQYKDLFTSPMKRAFAPFQMAYIILALDHAKGLGYATDKLLSWAASFVIEATKSDKTGVLLGNFVVPSVTSMPDSNIATWQDVAAAYKDPMYPATFTEGWLNSPDGMPLIMTAAAASIVSEPGGNAAWDWIKKNFVDRRTFPVTPRWGIVPRRP